MTTCSYAERRLTVAISGRTDGRTDGKTDGRTDGLPAFLYPPLRLGGGGQ